MEDINDIISNYTIVHDFFQTSGLGDYKAQCDYGGVLYKTNENIHAGDKFYSDNFIDSHFGKEIKMYPQNERLAKELAGNKLPISITIDDDKITITENVKKVKFIKSTPRYDYENQKDIEFIGDDKVRVTEYGNIPYSTKNDTDYYKYKYLKPYKTTFSYEDIHAYSKDSMLNIEHQLPNNPNYSLNVKFTKVNDIQPSFWQKFKNIFYNS
ncbi:hypothetical protein [Wolbachia endosymbiont of Chironomus riparius]|uniref:hypothetical protein n=1 Tax=Wolbachia endosymbiont of Chironomus riparius TaxID=2883238 RepID=UPI00209F12F9|nr:hypothetical protein [Wolbachia endosymbiont of Chironomus riparius]